MYYNLCVRFFPSGFEVGIRDSVVSAPGHCLSFYFSNFAKIMLPKGNTFRKLLNSLMHIALNSLYIYRFPAQIDF